MSFFGNNWFGCPPSVSPVDEFIISASFIYHILFLILVPTVVNEVSSLNYVLFLCSLRLAWNVQEHDNVELRSPVQTGSTSITNAGKHQNLMYFETSGRNHAQPAENLNVHF